MTSEFFIEDVATLSFFERWVFVSPLYSMQIPEYSEDDEEDDEGDFEFWFCDVCGRELKGEYIQEVGYYDRTDACSWFCPDCAMNKLNDAMNTNRNRCKKAIGRRRNVEIVNAIKMKFAEELGKARKVKNKISAIIIGGGSSL